MIGERGVVPVVGAHVVLALATIALAHGAAAAADGAGWHTPPSCWTEPRATHAPMDPDLAQRIALDSAPATARGPRARSPNRAYWFSIEAPDFTRPGPWTSRVLIFTERPELLRLTIVDHGDTAPTATWVNEKLLFVRIWWGRIAATDLVLDVESGEVLSQEMRWWGAIAFEQFKGQPCPR